MLAKLGEEFVVHLEGHRLHLAGRDDQAAALNEIFKEWSSPKPYQNRVQNLRSIDNSQFSNRLNGNSFLQAGVTVLDDGVLDQLSGEDGTDWFCRLSGEVLLDAQPNEETIC